jgi:hypothetical protein
MTCGRSLHANVRLLQIRQSKVKHRVPSAGRVWTNFNRLYVDYTMESWSGPANGHSQVSFCLSLTIDGRKVAESAGFHGGTLPPSTFLKPYVMVLLLL